MLHPGEGHFPLPIYGSHRLPEVTPPPTRARPQNHWFATGPQAPQGTLSPLCDTVAHRATGSQGSQPRPAALSISTASTNSPPGGLPGVALASRPPPSLGHPPAPFPHTTRPRYRRLHAPEHLLRRVPSVCECTTGAPPSRVPTGFSPADDRLPPPFDPHAVSRAPPSRRPGAPYSECQSTLPPRSPSGSVILANSSLAPRQRALAAWHPTIDGRQFWDTPPL